MGYGESGDRDGRGATVVRLFVEKVVAEQDRVVAMRQGRSRQYIKRYGTDTFNRFVLPHQASQAIRVVVTYLF